MIAASAALDDRSREVLRTLIQLHIQTGAPVGSETLAERLNRVYSPATVRSTMAELERQGYLAHPHTSAGRVPTDEGYRFYVDGLMTARPLQKREAQAIESQLRTGEGSPDQLLESASHLLSRLTRNVAFVLAPDISRASFGHIDLVRLPPPRVLVVMISKSGLITNRVIELEDEATQEELQACANYLNAHCAGLSLTAIRWRLLERMREEKALYDSLLRRVMSVAERAFPSEQGEGSVYLDGASHMLEQAHAQDLERLRSLFRTFEEKGRLVKILNACISDEGVRIYIGHENPDPDLRDLSVITAGYPLEGDASFGVGVLGSTRMEYARVISVVDYVARALTEALRGLRA